MDRNDTFEDMREKVKDCLKSLNSFIITLEISRQ